MKCTRTKQREAVETLTGECKRCKEKDCEGCPVTLVLEKIDRAEILEET